MKKIIVCLLFSSMAFINTSCTRTIGISSFPSGADIFMDGKKIGTTPYTTEEDKLGDPNSAGGYLLSIEKEGFQRFWLWQPSGLDGMNVSINLGRFPLKKSVTEKSEFSPNLKQVIDSSEKLLLMQKLLFSNKMNELESLIDQEEATFSSLGTFSYFKAVIALSKDNKIDALTAINRATELSPGVTEFIVLKNRISNKE